MNSRRNAIHQMSVLCLMLAIAITPVLGMAQTTTTSSPTVSKSTSKSTSDASSPSEIAAAKASGKVWVNTESRVYHKGGRWYGKTKAGKFMTESEAKAAGYKAAHRE